MRDGKTQRLNRSASHGGFGEFSKRFRAKIVVVEGGRAGEEHVLRRERLTLGRGPSVDVAFDDPSMSRQHAAIEYADEGFRIRDLGSTNGVLVNGREVQAAELSHGDRFEVGERTFQLVIEEHEPEPEVFELPSPV
jgi:pSer/pThr/pTyr-binding forkhead associated (FHA) protein